MRRGGTAFLVLAALAAPAAAHADAPQPKVQGNRLIDARNGQAFVPRGVNWPSFEYACSPPGKYGYSNTAGPTSSGPDAATAAAMASWHITAVRIPLNQDCWLGDDGLPGNAGGTPDGYRAAVRSFVDALNAAGIVAILDLHWTGPEGVVADGQRALTDGRSPAFWSSLAAAYAGVPSVMFDAFNEPYSRYDGNQLTFDLTWACWRDGGCSAPKQNQLQTPYDNQTFVTTGMTALVAAIRGAGAPQPILLNGRDYANDLREWLAYRPNDNQLVAGFHNYSVQRCHTAACWDAEIAPVAAQVPVVTGEFGQTDCQADHMNSFMAWADARAIGYLAWAWWVIGGGCDELAVISDPQGTPRAPLGTALKAHLDALAVQPPPPPPVPIVETVPRIASGLSARRIVTGRRVRIALDVRVPGGTLRAQLRRGGRVYARRTIRRLSPGRLKLTLTLDRSGRRSLNRSRTGRLRFAIRVVITQPDGRSATLARGVTLRRSR